MEVKDYVAEQQGYISRMPKILAAVYNRTPKACIMTYGCQQNVSDSERMKGMLTGMGYSLTEDINEADFVLFNTCAVRGHAEDRVFGNIGTTKALKKKNKNMIIAVCGCMAQQDIIKEKIKKSYPYVDIVFGTHVQYRLPEFLYILTDRLLSRTFRFTATVSLRRGFPLCTAVIIFAVTVLFLMSEEESVRVILMKL